MDSSADFLARFIGAVRGDTIPADPGLRIYGNTIRTSLIEVLAQTFPVTAALVGNPPAVHRRGHPL